MAERVDALAVKDTDSIEGSKRIEKLRIDAAIELHGLCAKFVRDLNGLVKTEGLTVDPPVFEAEHFRDGGPNLFQINVRGRILQLEFEVTENLISIENFREPYALEGAIRGFNQELLEHDAIEEENLYYCVDGDKTKWRVFDPRTYRAADLDEEYLIMLMHRLM